MRSRTPKHLIKTRKRLINYFTSVILVDALACTTNIKLHEASHQLTKIRSARLLDIVYVDWVVNNNFNNTDIYVWSILMNIRNLKVSKFRWWDVEDLICNAIVLLPENAADYYRNILHIMMRNDA